jgi:hypothetical protein
MSFTNVIDATDEGMQYLSTTGVWTGVDGGTVGNILTSNGTGVSPSFQSASASGAITTINSESPISGNFTLSSSNLSLTNSSGTVDFEDLRFTTQYVVDTSVTPGQQGTFTTIQAAVTAASAAGGGNVFIRAGTYPENVTVPSNVTLNGYSGETFNSTSSQTTILGSLTFSDVTNVNIFDLYIQGNGATIPLQFSGSTTTEVSLTNITVQASDSIVVSSTNANASAFFNQCFIYQDGAFSHFNMSAGFADISFSFIGASGAVNSSVPSIISGTGNFILQESIMQASLQLTGTAEMLAVFSQIGGSGIALDMQSTRSADLNFCSIIAEDGISSAINITSGATVSISYTSIFSNSSTHAVTGSGALKYDLLSFTNGANITLDPALTITNEVVRPFATGGSTNTSALRGLASFNSASFSVDTSGFVSLVSAATKYTNVNFAASPYTVLATDSYISVDTSGGAITLNFPNAPTAYREWVIKDRTGNAEANNITLTTPGHAVTFDSALLTNYIMTVDWQAIQILFNGTSYEIF